ncbi:DUF6709 family protein [Fusobacterium sp. THCT1E2]
MRISNVGYSIKRKNRLAAFLFIMGAILIFLFCLSGYVSYFEGSVSVAIDITVMWLLTGLSFFLVTAASCLIIKSEKDSYLGYLKDYCEKSSNYEYTWQKINELCSEKPLIKNVWINEKWMLFRIEKYLYIIDIDNIVWIYLEEARSNYSRKPIYGLCIAEETKNKYCIPVNENEIWIIDYLFKIHKRSLFGYNEEWQQLFENDFEKFKRFARKVS